MANFANSGHSGAFGHKKTPTKISGHITVHDPAVFYLLAFGIPMQCEYSANISIIVQLLVV